MLLRYTGARPVTFVRLGTELSFGDEFLVPDSEIAGYLIRADIEKVDAVAHVEEISVPAVPPEEPAQPIESETADDQGTGTDSTSS